MPLIRKRRAADPAPADSEQSDRETMLTTGPRRRPHNNDEAEEGSPTAGEESGSDYGATSAPSSTDAMVKKMVRLALASEYSRLVIRRSDISSKALGEQGARLFKPVFESAQRELRERFGMEMTELPAREKVTVTQRRAAQKVEKHSSTNKTWIVTSTLPAAYRNPSILVPTKAPSSATESTYTALYSFIIAVISLNGGSLSEQKLERYLARTNADTYTPIDRTDRFLQRLCREGYLVRNREMDGGEEVVEYIVGPRGKIEVGTSGVADLVREVYGRSSNDPEEQISQAETEEREEFENRLRRTLGISEVHRQQPQEGNQEAEQNREQENPEGGRTRASRRSLRRARSAEEEDDDEEEVEDDDDDENEGDEDEDSD